jgi:hypothetical protein
MMKLRTAATIILLVLSAPALAWSEKSHMTVGAIAFDDIAANSPQLLPQLATIIAAHPDSARLNAHLGNLTGDARTRAAFEWLARWPDDIRDGQWDNPKWHYELRVVSPWGLAYPFRNGTASAGFATNYAIFSNPQAAPAARAAALGWLLHIVGDIQQPLHAGHWMSWQFPLTDRAGTIAWVRRTPGGVPVDLHAYWDEVLDRPGVPIATPDAWAQPLEARWPRTALPGLMVKGAPSVQFSAWLDESRDLAKSVAYTGSFLNATRDPAAAPVVSAAYAQKAVYWGQRRVASGGYRAADVIRMGLAGTPL